MAGLTKAPSAMQDRSIITQDLLCAAAEAALRDGGLALCTVQEVARRADRSVGSVYRRFGDKDRMIAAVMDRCLSEILAANRRNFPLLAERHPRLDGRLQALIANAVAGQRRNWRLVEAFREAAAATSDETLMQAMVRLNESVNDLAKQALRDCAGEIRHPDKERAIDFAVQMLGAALQSISGDATLQIDATAFQTQLHAMLYGYLTNPVGEASYSSAV